MANTNTSQDKRATEKGGKSKTAVWGGVAFLLFVIAGLVFGGLKANQYLQYEQQMPVQVIDFSGDYQHIDITKLERLIRKAQPGSFFALDVNEVFELVEAQPWVYRASVRKKVAKHAKDLFGRATACSTVERRLVVEPLRRYVQRRRHKA